MAFRCRKNQASLTSSERARYVAAVLTLKVSGKYDQYVQRHVDSMAAANLWAHRGPAFFPWHRRFLLDFELDLQAIDASVTLPYWDWTVDNSPSSSIWDASFMGGDGRPLDGRVMTGPFAFGSGAWTLTIDGPDLRRRFGLSIGLLPSASEVTAAIGQTPYDVSPWNLSSSSGARNFFEGWAPIGSPHTHNRVHVWIGGSMGPASSPNDPVFFLHHCFVDKLWALWQAANPGAGYLPVTGAGPGHNLGDSMQPWAGLGIVVTPASVLDHHTLGYAYDTEGLCAGLPTLKVLDDPQTLKFRDDLQTFKVLDDPQTLKFSDDLQTLKVLDDPQTLKFRDDLQTLKLLDDPQTLKFRDDPQTLKVLDDPQTLKFRDDGPGTLKNIDDVKSPALDVGRGGETFVEATITPGFSGASQAPFVLATPHHSMAWTQTFPQAFASQLKHLEAQLSNLHASIEEHEAGERADALTPEESQNLAALRQEFTAVLAEYDAFLQRSGGTAS